MLKVRDSQFLANASILECVVPIVDYHTPEYLSPRPALSPVFLLHCCIGMDASRKGCSHEPCAYLADIAAPYAPHSAFPLPHRQQCASISGYISPRRLNNVNLGTSHYAMLPRTVLPLHRAVTNPRRHVKYLSNPCNIFNRRTGCPVQHAVDSTAVQQNAQHTASTIEYTSNQQYSASRDDLLNPRLQPKATSQVRMTLANKAYQI